MSSIALSTRGYLSRTCQTTHATPCVGLKALSRELFYQGFGLVEATRTVPPQGAPLLPLWYRSGDDRTALASIDIYLYSI